MGSIRRLKRHEAAARSQEGERGGEAGRAEHVDEAAPEPSRSDQAGLLERAQMEGERRRGERQARGENVIASQFDEDAALAAEAAADMLEGGAGKQDGLGDEY